MENEMEGSGKKTRTPSQVSLQAAHAAECTVGGHVGFASDEQQFSFTENNSIHTGTCSCRECFFFSYVLQQMLRCNLLYLFSVALA